MRTKQIDSCNKQQVKSNSDLNIGGIYQFVTYRHKYIDGSGNVGRFHSDKYGDKFKIKSLSIDKRKMNIVCLMNEDGHPGRIGEEQEISLADYSVIPYSPGIWNDRNYIIKIE